VHSRPVCALIVFVVAMVALHRRANSVANLDLVQAVLTTHYALHRRCCRACACRLGPKFAHVAQESCMHLHNWPQVVNNGCRDKSRNLQTLQYERLQIVPVRSRVAEVLGVAEEDAVSRALQSARLRL
jgi:hypothetical protein